MANYPDWVLAHKKKGTYINCVKGRYYLYAAHSERISGTNKVRRVSDGYIGRITEEDGLIPARDKIRGEVIVYEYGLTVALMDICSGIHKGLKREFRDAADWILVAGMLSAVYGGLCRETYSWSFLSVKFPDIDICKVPTAKQATALERCIRMITDLMKKAFGEDSDYAITRLSRIYMVKVDGKYYCSPVSENTKEWLSNHKIDWRDWFGKRHGYDFNDKGNSNKKPHT